MHRNADETFESYVENLGQDFGEAYYLAFSEYCDIWLTWKQYVNLFSSSPERVDLLNSAGSAFFARVQRTFFDAVILGICRLSDPTTSRSKIGKKKNLTVRIFLEFLTEEKHQKEFNLLLLDVDICTEFARDWRNRHVSHSDYHIRSGAELLQEATYNKIKTAISSLHKIFCFIENNFLNSDLDDEVIDDLNNEMVLLNRLSLGVAEFEKRLEG